MRDKVVRRYVPIQSLIAHPQNYKNHPQEQLNDLKSSLIRFGQIKPAVVQACAGSDDYLLVAGHGITMAAKQLLEDDATRYAHFNEWDVVVIPSSWSDSDIKGYMVADNLTGDKATDDEELLARLLQGQLDNGYDLASVGSDEETLRQMLTGLGDAILEGGGEEEEDERDIPGLDAPDLPYKNQFAVAVICSSEAEQQTVYDFLISQGYTCKVLVV